MQLKYSFKKEWAHFARTGRIIGVIAAILAFALSNPIIFKMASVMMEMVYGSPDGSGNTVFASTYASAGMGGDFNEIFGNIGMDEIVAVYSDAGMIFSTAIASFAGMSMLIVMLLLMAAAGGEQKKRATIVPMCSGLEYKNYLIPKFVIYPLTVFAVTAVSVPITGAFCNAFFPNNKVSAEVILLCTLMYSVYTLFLTCVYLAVGLCTSRPGVATVVIFFGQSFLQTIFNSMGLIDYNPFTLVTLPSYMIMEDFDISGSMPSIIVGIAISLVIAVMMFFLSLGVLNAKKIDNTEEERPEF
ncbi:MAG: hypothetical protein HDT43_08550 [Ruminococcaceae bacterium]|nr:hypothetical protein [Oscillospiraceae bacterium]